MTVISIDTHPEKIIQLQNEFSPEFETEISSKMEGNEHLFLFSELTISKDISWYESRKITVIYKEHPKQISWEIIYSYNSTKSTLDRNITITDVSELADRVNQYCKRYLIEQDYPPKELIEKDLYESLTVIEELQHTDTTHKKVLVYTIDTDTPTEEKRYYIQYRNPYHEEVSQYITLTSKTQDLQSCIKRDVYYGVICSKNIFKKVLYFILAEYTQLSDSQINTKIVTLCI